MLQYDRIDVSKVIDTIRSDGSHECFIFHCWYFLRITFRFQPKFAIVENDYRILFCFMSKDEAAGPRCKKWLTVKKKKEKKKSFP